MSDNTNPLTLPTPETRRTCSLNMRLSEDERASVDKLAAQQGVTTSALARHFVLQAVAFYTQRLEVNHDQPDW